MKRFLLIAGLLLLGIVVRAQSVSYTCRYWFDHEQGQMVTATANGNILQMELEADLLLEGIHNVFIQVRDTLGMWCAAQSYMFYKVPEPASINPVNPADVVYHCWFDNDIEHEQIGALQTGAFLLDADALESGLHTLFVAMEGDGLTSTQSYMFYKAPELVNPVTPANLAYHCWFDEDIEHEQTGQLQTGVFLLDADALESGLHTLFVALEGDGLTSTQSYLLYKAPEPVTPVDPENVVYHCWFDNDIEHEQTGALQTGAFLLDVDALESGLHTLFVALEGNGLTSTQIYMFYKAPLPEKEHIARWEYWLNDDINHRHTTNLSPYLDSLSIISLLPVETWPVRSSCFHFHPNGEEPYLNAKNMITFRFWNTQRHFIDKSELFVDENVVEPIVADTLERNATTVISAPRDNQIHWFKVVANRGDYLSFRADKACTMQLFAPSGEEVYAASGPESIQEIGFNAWENGTYYLAVHDVTGSGETVSVTYNWVYRYVIASYDVHLVGNGGCSTITFQGNGFNSLLDAYLVNYQNDTIRQLDIGHESNTTTTISFNFYEVNLGTYDAVFEFFEETIRINGALEVQEPVDILLTTTVSYPSQFLINTPCTYTYTITNNGNMSAYAVPLFVYIATPTLDGISHLEIDGLDLPSFMDYFDLDSLSSSEKEDLLLLSNEEGEDHCFFMFPTIDANTGDSIYIRSNYFFMNLAPFETKTIILRITADTPIEVQVTIPEAVIPPLTFLSNRGIQDVYCCSKEWITCKLGVLCSIVDLIDLVVGIIPGVPYKVAVSFASCVCDIISLMNTQLTQLLCENESPTGFFDMLNKMNYNSMIGAAASCFKKKLLKGLGLPLDIWKILQLVNKLKNAFMVGFSDAAYSCSQQMMEPAACIGNPPKGGEATPVNSLDPNDIYGYLSESGSHHMRQEIQNVQYEIEFENDTTLANAAAHTIIVRDTLDATKFDLNSLAARSVTIGDKRLDLNGEQTFARTLDMRPELYVIAQINQDYDPTTGIIQWTIQSLDPMTMEPTNDPNQGVLPVNYNGNGVGFIDYSVNLKQAFADGIAISNRAGIIFDQNDVILTPTWTNIIDAVKPTSHIENAVVEADSLHFNFVSSDNRSGVWYHALYYRNNSTEQEWQVRKPQIFGNTYMLPLDSLQTTEYLVMAVDSAGNREEKEMVAEVIVEANVHGFPFFVSGYGESEGGWKLIASPVAGSIEATTVANIFSATDYDLYYYDQGEVSEWRNYKSEPFELENGQGYLYATKEGQTLVFRGTHNVADTYEVTLAYTEDNPNPSKRGWNLIGNPFTVPAYVDRSYYTMNEDGSAIEPNAASSATAIPACNGVMVKAEAPNETVIFSKATRWNAPNQSGLQITVTQVDKNDSSAGSTIVDKAIISFNPGDQLGKFDFNSNAVVYLPQGGKDYAIVSVGGDAARHVSTTEIPVNFKATENGQYTISVNPEGVEMSYLHLIDNLTGADIDLLGEFPLSKEDQGDSTPQPVTYTFTAKPTDQASRFRLVFSFYGDTGIDVKE